MSQIHPADILEIQRKKQGQLESSKPKVATNGSKGGGGHNGRILEEVKSPSRRYVVLLLSFFLSLSLSLFEARFKVCCSILTVLLLQNVWCKTTWFGSGIYI